MPVNLTHLALRTSKTISEKVKEDGGGGYSGLGNKFNDSLEIVDNMPLGPEPLIIPSSEGTYKVRLQHACNTVAKDKSALAIINLAKATTNLLVQIGEDHQNDHYPCK